MTLALSVPALASTNVSAHHIPKLQGDQPIVNPVVDKLNSALDQYKAKPLHATKIEALIKPYSIQAVSSDPFSTSDLKIGYLHPAKTGVLAIEKLRVRNIWIAIAIAVSVLVAGIILVVACPPLLPLGVIISAVGFLALCFLVGQLSKSGLKGLHDESHRKKVCQELELADFKSVSQWDYTTLVGYDLLRLKFASLSEESKQQAYHQVAHQIKQYHSINYFLHDEVKSSLYQEYNRGLASEQDEMAQMKERIGQICEEARHSIDLKKEALLCDSQTAPMLPTDCDLKNQVDIIELVAKEWLAKLFSQKEEAYLEERVKIKAQLGDELKKISAAYKALGV